MSTFCAQLHDDSRCKQQSASLTAIPSLLYVTHDQDSENMIKSRDAIIQYNCLKQLRTEHMPPVLMTCMIQQHTKQGSTPLTTIKICRFSSVFLRE